MILPIHKILCPTDFSDPSYEGLEAAVELARHFKAELVVAHVISPIPIVPGSVPTAGSYLPRMLKELEDSARNTLQSIVENRIPEDVSAKTMVVVGTPAQEIAQAAITEKANVIIMATHGQSGWKRFIIGSVTERVVRVSDRPVLTIHSPEKDEKEEES